MKPNPPAADAGKLQAAPSKPAPATRARHTYLIVVDTLHADLGHADAGHVDTVHGHAEAASHISTWLSIRFAVFFLAVRYGGSGRATCMAQTA